MGRIPTLLAVFLLVFVLGTNVYRARTQSFTADEALSYNQYVSAPLRATFTDFDANNHVLNTLLEKLSVALFGTSEFTLRLPSLAGGAFFLGVVFILSRRMLGDGWLSLLCVAVLALNPFVLDFLSAARGYGAGLALLLWALDRCFRFWDEPSRETLFQGAIALALAVAFNLTMAFPGIAIAALFSVRLIASRRWADLIDGFLLPGLLVVFLLLGIVLSGARHSNFYVGASALTGTLESMVESSIYHAAEPQPGHAFWWLRRGLYSSFIQLAPLVAVFCIVWLAWRLRRRSVPFSREQRHAALCGCALVGSIFLAAGAHAGLGLPYPLRRTGLFLIPLFCLTSFALMRLATRNRWSALTLMPAGVMFFFLSVIQFVCQWNTGYYLEWKYDSRTKEIVQLIDGLRDRSRPSVSVSVTWPVASTVEFYRRTLRLDWLEIKGRHVDKSEADYYILALEERTLADKLQVLFRDDAAEVLLARPIVPPVRP